MNGESKFWPKNESIGGADDVSVAGFDNFRWWVYAKYLWCDEKKYGWKMKK